MSLKTLPYETRAQERLRAASISLDRYVESALRALETPTERMVVAHPDLCVWMFRRFRLEVRYYIKRRARSGILMLGLGWVVLTFRV